MLMILLCQSKVLEIPIQADTIKRCWVFDSFLCTVHVLLLYFGFISNRQHQKKTDDFAIRFFTHPMSWMHSV